MSSTERRNPTERFVEVLCETFSARGMVLDDEQRVRMEDAFNDAVEARVQQRETDAAREYW